MVFLVRSFVEESLMGSKGAKVKKRSTTSKFQEGLGSLSGQQFCEEQALIISFNTWSLLMSNPLIAKMLLSMALQPLIAEVER